jgi:hypothetical protein
MEELNERDFIRVCAYRNCGCVIPITTRSDAKFCNIKCRGNERTYIKREMKRLRKEQQQIVENLIQIEKNKEILDLYLKIFKK